MTRNQSGGRPRGDYRFEPLAILSCGLADTISQFTPMAALFLLERMLEEKTKHFPRCVRSSRISVGARGTASGPRVSGPVDIPVLQHSTSARVAQDRSGIGMPSGYLPAMHLLLCPDRSHRLLKNLTAVAWVHGSVAIAVKNNGRNGCPAT